MLGIITLIQHGVGEPVIILATIIITILGMGIQEAGGIIQIHTMPELLMGIINLLDILITAITAMGIHPMAIPIMGIQIMAIMDMVIVIMDIRAIIGITEIHIALGIGQLMFITAIQEVDTNLQKEKFMALAKL